MSSFSLQSWAGVSVDPSKAVCFDVAGCDRDDLDLGKFIVVSDGAGAEPEAKAGAEHAVAFTSRFLTESCDRIAKLVDSEFVDLDGWRRYSVNFCSTLKVEIGVLAEKSKCDVDKYNFTLLVGFLSQCRGRFAWFRVGDGGFYRMDSDSSLNVISRDANDGVAPFLFNQQLEDVNIKSGVAELGDKDWRVVFATSDGMDVMFNYMIAPRCIEHRKAMLCGFGSGLAKAFWPCSISIASASRDEYLKAMLAADIWGADDRSLAAIIRLESSADDSRVVAPVSSDSHNSSPACPVSLIKVFEGRSSVESKVPSGDYFTGDSEKSIGIKKLSEGNARKASSGDFRSVLPWSFVMMLAPVSIYYWIEDFNNVAKIKNLKDDLHSANMLNHGFRRDLAERDASIAGLNTDLVRAKMRLDEFSKDREKYMGEISDALRESGDFKKKNQALEARVNSLHNEIDLKSREIARLAEKVDRLEKEKLMAPRVNPSFPASGSVGYK